MPSRNIAFYDLLAPSYHLFFHDMEASMQQEGHWLSEILEPVGPRSVLDASCGTGRQAIPLAQRGFAVTAADPSAAMLDIARTEAGRRGVSINFVQCTFDELPARVPGPYDAVISMGNGLCNQDRVQDIRTSLAALRACCTGRGICVLGTKDFDRIRLERPRLHSQRVVDGPDGTRLLVELWSYEDPVLVSTAFLLTQRCGSSEWNTEVATTREYMLGHDKLTKLALGVGFRSCDLIPHRCEAAYLLQP
jgi:SAM-dependent methyltransferase